MSFINAIASSFDSSPNTNAVALACNNSFSDGVVIETNFLKYFVFCRGGAKNAADGSIDCCQPSANGFQTGAQQVPHVADAQSRQIANLSIAQAALYFQPNDFLRP